MPPYSPARLAIIAVAFALLVAHWFMRLLVGRRDCGTSATLGGELFINLKILNTLQSRQTEQSKHDDGDQHGSDSQCQ
jgi:hypothetical protein